MKRFLPVSVFMPYFFGFLLLFCFLTTPFTATARTNAPETFADLTEKMLPAVVNISTTQEVRSAQVPSMQMPALPPGSPFEDFFREFFERGMPQSPNQQNRPPRRATSLGSGFIISENGLVITNNHVIADAAEIKVILNDNTELDAEVVGHDPKTDLAVLRVKTNRKLPSVTWGDSEAVRVGDWVLAIGNPFGLGGSVTAGIISARARNINAGPYDDFFQTDAAINRGNSGGPMFNMQGEVIGINTAIFSPTGGSVGIGFSIPSNLAQPVIKQLIEFGRTKRGWLGVQIQPVTQDIADSLQLPVAVGALVASVTPDSPAEKAGLQAGDIILEFNDREIPELRVLPRLVAETPVGQRSKVVLWRDGKKKTAHVVLGELEAAEESAVPQIPTTPQTSPAKGTVLLGLEVSNLTPALRQLYALPTDTKGVVITDTQQNAIAEERGVAVGTVIIEANRQAVDSVATLEKIIAAAKKAEQRSLLLRLVNRSGDRLFVALPL